LQQADRQHAYAFVDDHAEPWRRHVVEVNFGRLCRQCNLKPRRSAERVERLPNQQRFRLVYRGGLPPS
jgi:hypothetical protein